MVANSAERIAELGKLLKGKVQADWVLLDESCRELFDELMGLIRHRESVVACLMHQAARRRARREHNDGGVGEATAQAVQ